MSVSHFIRFILFTLVWSPALALADAVVTFNEVNYNPPDSQDGEWLELHNQMAVNVDLSGWRLADGISYSFPQGTVIAAGGYLVVAKDPADVALRGLSGVLGPFSGNLSNSGETIELISRSGRVMDRLTYSDTGDWPIAADGAGATLVKLHSGTHSADALSWTSGPVPGGTPGEANFPASRGPIRHTLVRADSSWRYSDSNTEPAANWTSRELDDASWKSGHALFGAGSGVPVLTVTSALVERFRAADLGGIAHGGIFERWPDSASSDGVSQDATAGGNPTYRAAATPNSRAVVRFDGNDEFRTAVPPGISPAAGFAYFIVCKANAAPNNGGIYDGAGDYLFDRDISIAEQPLVSLKAVNNRYGFQKRDDGSGGIGGPVSTTPISTSQFQIVTVRRNPAAARFEIWVDGVLEGSTPDEGDNLTPQPIVIGRHSTNVNSGFNGDIAELLVYQDALSEADFQSVGAYLSTYYGLATAFPKASVSTQLAAAQTRYFRKSFNFAGDSARTALRLDHMVADGAVFYLNGQELIRTNLPAGTVNHGTTAIAPIVQPVATGLREVPATALVNGTNVLAVSLHQAEGDPDSWFAAALEATEDPPDDFLAATLQLNEIAGTGDGLFFVELRNAGRDEISTAGYTLGIVGGRRFSLPTIAVPAGGMVSFTAAELGFRAAAGDKIVLTGPGSRLEDVKVAQTTAGGRGHGDSEQWLRPTVTTPNADNQFALTSAIVINEICYKAPDLPAVPAVPDVTQTLSLIHIGSSWRYRQSTEGLSANWASIRHETGGDWRSGAGILGFCNTPLPTPIVTPLVSPALNRPFVVTYYFETDFVLTAGQAASLSRLDLTHLIDDGAIFYLNGVEISRYNMPAGAVTPATYATPGVATAAMVGPVAVNIPAGTAVSGVNRLSVEVHQNNSTSSDIVFGLQVTGTVVTIPGSPEIPVRESRQQWIELYNRGETAVDLSGWKFDAGVEYVFPTGTILEAAGYLVVARQPDLVAAAAGVPVLGPWSGSLSGKGERIRLRDPFGNPADEVSYLDGGRWPETPDGGGTTLELRDSRSDNSLPEAWSASREEHRRSWETITYEGGAAASAVGPDGQWREFIFGLLDAGEILIDDISVSQVSGGGGGQLIVGGDFESDTGGWRFLGNHSDARVVTDPENPSNRALYLRATGATEHMHNHVETTLANGQSISNGRRYRISFKVKWLSGCNLLNTRLYFNRLAKTTVLARPQILGTPGGANSSVSPNVGPGYQSFSHSPAVPKPGESVTVTTRVADPDGLGGLTLYYSPSGGTFVAVPMVPTDRDGGFAATIPGFSAASVVRFYVAATDAASVPSTSYFPAAGPASHALYQVDDNLAATNGLNNIRIVMDPVDKATLYRTNNLMSNGRLGCTVIYRESEIYYNVGVRLKSSQRGRQNAARVGFNLSFNDDQLFRGVHGTIAIDRSEGQITGAQELLYDHMMYASGGIPAECNDLVKVIAPDPAHTSTAILQMARFGSVFLDSQFENGADGTVYEYELIYYPTTTDSQGYKVPQPDNVVGVSVRPMGDDKENYRWTYLTKNNEEKNDYSGVIEMCRLFDQSGSAFEERINEVLDVDQWLRALAYSCASGAGDSFFVNSNHNGQFYARPSDGRMLYFPHDMDYSFNATLPIFSNVELQKLTADPARRRSYLGHLHDICSTVFNRSYMAPWVSHYGALLPKENFPGHLNYIDTRSNYILSAINSAVSPLPFAITTNGGKDFATADSPVTLAGRGWIDVRQIRLAGSSTPLVITWTSVNTWETAVALGPGANEIELEAIDFSGEVVGTASIVVTNSGNIRLPDSANLVVSEIYYNPLVADDLSEYLELLNISTATLDLSGLAVTQGIVFSFPNGTRLAPGGRVVIVKDRAAFENEFGNGRPIGGVFVSGSLDNAGEVITLRRTDNTVVRSFSYSDDPPWPTFADTAGHSLVLIDPFRNPDHSDPLNWRASVAPGGSPGGADHADYEAWKASHGNPSDPSDEDGDGLTTAMEYFLGGDPRIPDPELGPKFSRAPDGTLVVSIARRADVSGKALILESSEDLIRWQAAGRSAFVSSIRESGVPLRDRLEFRLPPTAGRSRTFLRFAIH
jgi:hypothetical protein